jgi:hypothetical protein
MLLLLAARRERVQHQPGGVAGAELTLVAPRFSITAILLPTAAKEPVRGANKAEPLI